MDYLMLPTIADLLVRNTVEVPDRDFLVIAGSRLTYRQMHERAVDTARSLRALGVDRGDTVALLMPNCVTFIEVVFGCAYLGAVAVPINSRFRRNELRHVIPDCGARVLVLDDSAWDQADHTARLREALPDLPGDGADPAAPLALETAPHLRHVVAMHDQPGGLLGGDAFRALAAESDAAEVDAARRGVALRHPGMMFYTSGTTSNPKGCLLSNEALVRVGVSTAERLSYGEGAVLYDPLPMFHTASTQPMLASMWVRGTFVSQVFPEPREALELIAAEGVTDAFTAFPTITESLLDHPDYTPDTFTSLRTLFNVGPPDAQRSMQSRMPHTVLVNAFGMTEVAGSASMVSPDDDDDARLTTQGSPLPGMEIVIRDEDGEPVPAGELGEVSLRGPTLFGGYHNAPEKNAETFDDDGFWYSGDLGMLDDMGRLLFKGRAKDMLKVGGENVAAIEIESHLQTHPGVKIAQVVGVPDPTYMEVPAAFVELRAGVSCTEQELIDHCKGQIASFKVPRMVRFVSEWPMSSTKVQKFKLREMIEQERAAAG